MTRNNTLIALLLLALPLTGWAQDDMYFVPKKKAEKAVKTQRSIPVEIVYADEEPLGISGSTRDVDEYNRRTPVTTSGEAQLVQQPDGTFAFQVSADDSARMAADQLYTQGYRDGYIDGEDYTLTRRMNRFNYVSLYASPWYWSVRYDPFYYDDWYWGYSWSRPYWGYSGYYGYYRPYYGWGWGYSYHRPYHYGYHRRPYNVGRPAYPGGGYTGRGTQYRDRYYNLRTADRNYVTPRNRSTQRSVRGGGQSAPMGSRGGSYINGGRGTSSTVTPSTSRSNSVSTSRSVSVPSSSRSSGGGFSGGSSRGGSGSGFGGGGGGGSRGGSRGGRR